MKAILAIYLSIALFMGIVEDLGYSGATYTDDITVIDDITNETTKFDTGDEGIGDALKASAGLLGSFIKIVIKSLMFSYTIIGAPDVVNLVIRTVLGILGWFALYDFIILIVGALSGVVSRVF